MDECVRKRVENWISVLCKWLREWRCLNEKWAMNEWLKQWMDEQMRANEWVTGYVREAWWKINKWVSKGTWEVNEKIKEINKDDKINNVWICKVSKAVLINKWVNSEWEIGKIS